MCCGTPTTLYGTTTLTSSYTTVTPVTTTIPPHASYSYLTTVRCASSSSSTCVSTVPVTYTAVFDYFYPVTSTTTVTKVVPVTTTKTYPTATKSTPCPHKRDSELLEEFEKRGAASPTTNMGSKLGVAIVALLLSSTLIA